ncbi:alpha/beta fold hydrolase [Caulobacter henricii]|uniref:alpha/beta fold hydrolase n=1 Tax=Caulobacter henricii TaxID=69395 RepID=UPI000B271E4F|nr:alpha/beta hydrolase [Caulobacter henricii]
MRSIVFAAVALMGVAPSSIASTAVHPAQQQAAPSTPRTTFITTSDGVRLEVLDYGGQGSPILLASGGGMTAHAFDQFAPRLAARHRVFAFTRRALGQSDTPPQDPGNYTLTRLTRDVVEVLDGLKIEKATLAGWSFGGAEISGVAHHFPERVSALVYLDAAYAYVFYAPGNAAPDASNIEIDLADLRDKLQAARFGSKEDAARIYDEVLAKDLADLATDVRAAAERRRLLSKGLAEGPPAPLSKLMTRHNMEKFPAITGIPILAIFSIPGALLDPTADQRADEALQLKWLNEQIDRYRAAHPAARVLTIDGADHDVFNSHPEIVLREIETLLNRSEASR